MYITMGNSNSYRKHNDMMNYIEDRLDNLIEKVSNNSNILRQITDVNSQMSNDILEMKKKILNNRNIFEKLVEEQDNLQITDDIINTIISESDTWLPDDTEKTLLKNSVKVVLLVLRKKLLHEREK